MNTSFALMLSFPVLAAMLVVALNWLLWLFVRVLDGIRD